MSNVTLEEVWALFKETDRKFQETDRLLKEISKESEKRAKESENRINKLEALFTSQWGKLVESLVEGALVNIFNERGIPVQQTSQRAKGIYQGNQWELDIIVKNGDVVIIVEVKTTLRPSDVKHFLKKLPQVKSWLKEYANNTIYGAMAYLSADAGAEIMAQNKGLFTIKATGDSARLENPHDFKPHNY